MNRKKQFDFWYAVNNTELITLPTGQLETFGDTVVNYHLVCQQMDSIEKVCVREGRIKALKPAIITPQMLGQLNLYDFGPEAKAYAEWLAEYASNLRMLQYGFRLQKCEQEKYVVIDHIDNVLEKVKEEVAAKNDPLSSILVGVDDPWEVCLIKLMVELAQHSTRKNIRELQQHSLNMKKKLNDDVERGFLEASRDSGRISELAEMLRKNGLWEAHEDRFFALVKAAGKKWLR